MIEGISIRDLRLRIPFDHIPESEISRFIRQKYRRIINDFYQEKRDLIGNYSRTTFQIDDKFSALGYDTLFIRADLRIDWANYPALLESVKESAYQNASRNEETFQWLVYSENYTIKIIQIYSPYELSFNPEHALNIMKSQEIGELIEDEDVLFHHSNAAHFRLPSGYVSDYFFRVGNSQRQMNSLNVLAFWSLPYLSDMTTILAETWSVSTTAAHFAQFIRVYDEDRDNITWSFLGGYLPKSSEDERHLRSILDSVRVNGGHLLLIVSANASGKLHDYFDNLVKIFFKADNIEDYISKLTLYSLNSNIPNGNLLFDATPLLNHHGLVGSIDDESNQSKNIIEVNWRTYFPDYRIREIDDFKLGKQLEESRKFFNKYSGHKIFSVARDGATHPSITLRHHAFHADFKLLNKHPAFRKRISECIASIGPVDLIISRKDEASEEFFEAFQSIYNESYPINPFERKVFDSFDKILNDDIANKFLLDDRKTIVLLDPLYITGGHVRDLAIAIRTLNAQGKPSKARVRHLVGLFRPETDQKEKYGKEYFPKLSNHDGYNGEMLCVEEIRLPNWQGDKCPWRRELQIHKLLFDSEELLDEERAYLQQRIEVLEKSGTIGLRGSDVFFKRYPGDQFVFNPGSFFLDTAQVIVENSKYGIELSHADIDHADLLCATASAFQYWRETNKKKRPAFYQLKPAGTIAPEIAADQNGFNEPALRAAIWRTLAPTELAFDKDDTDLQTILAHIFAADDDDIQRVLGGEAALAFGSALPRLMDPERFEAIDWKYLKSISAVSSS